ncbi:LytTR family DNA-binding domain-containing protein [Parapedobacter sp. 10938]|uniref:LytTR family DNA-binding domain-containing protein n=1 Tax=Parapedobacter flavus TaxID=3110225 RepID=UPI002DB6E267|nr:LytTR family DNA-binding domain-containing protein [Parapedobacter sp. 10938]MEC3880612.1 LytTR family DNA-binding domain-containing protein [Parapedobacter sp. 10938]
MDTKTIIIRSTDKTDFVNCDQICYCLASASYAEITLENGFKITVTKPLKWVASQADLPYLIRISQSALVNIKHIVRIHPRDRTVEMTDGEQIRFTLTIKKLEWLIQEGSQNNKSNGTDNS